MNNNIDLITPENKLKFLLAEDTYKKEIKLQQAKVSREKMFLS